MSTLETAVVFTIILTMLTFFVTAPEKTAMEALSDCRMGFVPKRRSDLPYLMILLRKNSVLILRDFQTTSVLSTERLQA